MSVKKVVVVSDEGSDEDAIYIDGVFFAARDLICASDIVRAVGGEDVPFTLSQIEIENAKTFPKSLADLTPNLDDE